MCRLLLGRFTALKSSLHWLSVKRTKAVEEALNRWTRKALDDEMPGDLFLSALANSIISIALEVQMQGHHKPFNNLPDLNSGMGRNLLELHHRMLCRTIPC